MDPRLSEKSLRTVISAAVERFTPRQNPVEAFKNYMNPPAPVLKPGGPWREVSPTQTPQPTATPQAVRPVYKPVKGKGRNPDFHKKPMTPQVQQAIQAAAGEFGVPDSLLYDIAYSESGFRPDAKNETPEGKAVGVPVGLFQFTPGTWNNDLYNYAQSSKTTIKDLNPRVTPREDPVANARAAAYLIKHGQLAKWDASISNWGRFYEDDEIADYYSQSPGHSKRRKQ